MNVINIKKYQNSIAPLPPYEFSKHFLYFSVILLDRERRIYKFQLTFRCLNCLKKNSKKHKYMLIKINFQQNKNLELYVARLIFQLLNFVPATWQHLSIACTFVRRSLKLRLFLIYFSKKNFKRFLTFLFQLQTKVIIIN